MLHILGNSQKTCSGVRRRELLQVGGMGLLGLQVPRLLALEEQNETGLKAKVKSVIFLFLFGGPSQLETFDMKPKAPEKIRGPFKPISSRTSGLSISEYLPKTAMVSDKFCAIRTVTHNYNDHSGAGHYIQTGHRWQIPIRGGFSATDQDWPSMGSIVDYLRTDRKTHHQKRLPNYVVLPNWLGALQEKGQYRRPGQYGGWLGKGFDPLNTNITKRDLTDNPYWRDCTDEELHFAIQGLLSSQEMTLARLSHRRSLLEQFDSYRTDLDQNGLSGSWDQFRLRALDLVTSDQTRTALDIQKEPTSLRDRYGRHLYGQSCLMARRLIEAGVRFVTVHYDSVDGYSWDSHRSSHHLKNYLIPTFDDALSALLDDLQVRGLLDETLVVAMGEMGRTPQANAQWGRGHWSTVFPAILAGGGVRGGIAYGNTDSDAGYPMDHPVTPEDLAATIYWALGIDPNTRITDRNGRPVPIQDGGKPLVHLFG